MGVLESVKEKIEKVTGWKRPSRGNLRDAVRSRKPNSFRTGASSSAPQWSHCGEVPSGGTTAA
jgi:hypothetical protein